MIRETELLSLIVCFIFRIQFSRNRQCITLPCESVTCFLNSASCFPSVCFSTYVEMTRFIPHVMSSHMEHKCIFIWVLNWYFFCCSRIDITTGAEIEISESSDETDSIRMQVSSGPLWHVPGMLSAQKVEMRMAPLQGAKRKPLPLVFSHHLQLSG